MLVLLFALRLISLFHIENDTTVSVFPSVDRPPCWVTTSPPKAVPPLTVSQEIIDVYHSHAGGCAFDRSEYRVLLGYGDPPADGCDLAISVFPVNNYQQSYDYRLFPGDLTCHLVVERLRTNLEVERIVVTANAYN